jgi:hypothetical protein
MEVRNRMNFGSICKNTYPVRRPRLAVGGGHVVMVRDGDSISRNLLAEAALLATRLKVKVGLHDPASRPDETAAARYIGLP